jgi:hypothetical protein
MNITRHKVVMLGILAVTPRLYSDDWGWRTIFGIGGIFTGCVITKWLCDASVRSTNTKSLAELAHVNARHSAAHQEQLSIVHNDILLLAASLTMPVEQYHKKIKQALKELDQAAASVQAQSKTWSPHDDFDNLRQDAYELLAHADQLRHKLQQLRQQIEESYDIIVMYQVAQKYAHHDFAHEIALYQQWQAGSLSEHAFAAGIDKIILRKFSAQQELFPYVQAACRMQQIVRDFQHAYANIKSSKWHQQAGTFYQQVEMMHNALTSIYDVIVTSERYQYERLEQQNVEQQQKIVHAQTQKAEAEMIAAQAKLQMVREEERKNNLHLVQLQQEQERLRLERFFEPERRRLESIINVLHDERTTLLHDKNMLHATIVQLQEINAALHVQIEQLHHDKKLRKQVEKLASSLKSLRKCLQYPEINPESGEYRAILLAHTEKLGTIIAMLDE